MLLPHHRVLGLQTRGYTPRGLVKGTGKLLVFVLSILWCKAWKGYFDRPAVAGVPRAHPQQSQSFPSSPKFGRTEDLSYVDRLVLLFIATYVLVLFCFGEVIG